MPVITSAEDGSEVVGEFYRDVGRPKRERNRRGGQFRNWERDLAVYWLLHYAGKSWADIVKLIGSGPDEDDAKLRALSFEAAVGNLEDRMRKPLERLEKHVIPLAPGVLGAVYGLSDDELEFVKRRARDRLQERASRKRLIKYKPPR